MLTTEALWGGTLLAVRLDPTTHDLELDLSATRATQTRKIRVRCRAASDVHFDNSIPLPWAYAEITEAHATQDHATSLWRLQLMLWSEDSGLDVTCADISIELA